MKEVIFAGFGGQGVLTAGLVLAYAAMEKDCNVSWMPAYGPEMRGGTANSCVKFGEEPGERSGTPTMNKADAAVIMNIPSLKFLHFCKPGATILINANTIDKSVEIPEGYQVIYVDSDAIAHDVKNAKGTSIVMLGALTKLCGYFDKEHMIASMNKMFAEKGKSKFEELNVKAFEAGYKAV